MSNVQLFTLLAALLLGAASPGPSFLFVVRASAGDSRKAGIIAALGMGVGATVWAIAALLGISGIFMSRPWLYASAQIIGGVFLLWIAFKIWRHASEPIEQSQKVTQSYRKGVFREAVKFQLANPKVAIFFSSIFVAVLPKDGTIGFQFLLPVIVFINEVVWYSFVALILSMPKVQKSYLRTKTWIDRSAAIMIALIGTRLIFGQFL
jgi:threonine/homoserine/homoserine lactone efflux protein